MRSRRVLTVALAVQSARAFGHTPEEPPIELEVRGEATEGPDTAARLSISRKELLLRPSRSPGDLLEAAPGLVVAQHAGGGKANQYFLRGFDADHGTDVALLLDGVPLNQRSHGHGQGYTDFNFVIPELIQELQIEKGPYDVRYGDFATAGVLQVRYLDHLPEHFVQGELGQFGQKRALVAVSPHLDDDWSSLVAAEVVASDGPFQHPEEYRKTNLVGTISRELSVNGRLRARFMSYAATWNASGQLPLRAVCGEGEPGFPPPSAYGQPCIDRFGSIDPSEGGRTQRQSAEVGYRARAGDLEVDALLYAVRYRFGLYSNFTFFASDPVRGDGIEQTDERSTVGATLRATHGHALGPIGLRSTFGIDTRADDIDNALYHQQRRERLETVNAAHVVESSAAAFVEERAVLTRWLSVLAGLRFERLQADVDGRGGDQISGSTHAELALPKFGVEVSPLPALWLFGNYGRGYHSNDARSSLAGGTDLMAPALGYEAGARWAPSPDLQAYASAFLLDLASELVWVGDEGTTEASPESRRMGVELGLRARFRQWLFADADLTVTRARYATGDDADRVPLAPTRTLTAGLGAQPRFGDYRPFGAVRVRAIADRPANEDGSLVAQGYTVCDVGAGLRYRNVEAALDVLNVFDTSFRLVNFATTSRLQYEPEPLTSVHFVPGWSRTVVARVALYWD